MRGPAPKDPALRQRRNKVSTRATLHVQDGGWKRAPSLPKREDSQEWHALTRAFWYDVWHSPLSPELLKVDIHGLYRLAALVDRFWKAPSVSIEAQILRSGSEYGITPMSRRRLQWIVERVESGKKESRQRSVIPPSDDPRKLLQVVS